MFEIEKPVSNLFYSYGFDNELIVSHNSHKIDVNKQNGVLVTRL